MRNLAAQLAFFAWMPLWGQSPSVGVDPGHNQKQQTKLGATQTQADQRGTQNSPLVVDMVQHPKSPQETAETEREKRYKAFIDGWTLGIAGLVALFTGILVIIGFRGVLAANRTLKAIEKQAELQAASMTQWVSVQNWKVSLFERIGDGVSMPTRLEVTFDIANESNFPLNAEFIFRFFGKLPNAASYFTGGRPQIMFPRKPYNAKLNLYPTEDQVKVYSYAALQIAVHGEIIHVGVTKEQSPLMSIRGNLVCGANTPTRLDFESISMVPMTEREGGAKD